MSCFHDTLGLVCSLEDLPCSDTISKAPLCTLFSLMVILAILLYSGCFFNTSVLCPSFALCRPLSFGPLLVPLIGTC